MGDERVDLEIAEPVEVGADARHLGLHDGVQGMGILVGIDQMRDRQKLKTVAVAKVLALELPDPVPEDVGRPDRLRHESQRRVAENLKRLAGIADHDPVERPAAMPHEPRESACAEIVVDPTVGK